MKEIDHGRPKALSKRGSEVFVLDHQRLGSDPLCGSFLFGKDGDGPSHFPTNQHIEQFVYQDQRHQQ